MLDDFWGEREWQNVQEQMRKVFPEYSIQELPMDHPIFHCYFDLTEVVQVPEFRNWFYSGVTYEKGGTIPHYSGLRTTAGGSWSSSRRTPTTATPGSGSTSRATRSSTGCRLSARDERDHLFDDPLNQNQRTRIETDGDGRGADRSVSIRRTRLIRVPYVSSLLV